MFTQGMKKAKAHGIGVHSQEEIIEFGKNDLRVLSDLLSDKPFFFGNEPTLVSMLYQDLLGLHNYLLLSTILNLQCSKRNIDR